jgi:hypothetical protein
MEQGRKDRFSHVVADREITIRRYPRVRVGLGCPPNDGFDLENRLSPANAAATAIVPRSKVSCAAIPQDVPGWPFTPFVEVLLAEAIQRNESNNYPTSSDDSSSVSTTALVIDRRWSA